NPAVGHSLGKSEQGTPFSASWERYRTPPGRPTFPGIGVIGVKSWQKTTRKNRGPSERSPRCLNAVNPAVAISAPKNQLRGKWFSMFDDFGAARRNLSGIDLNPDCVETCARSFPGAEVQVGDATSLPWGNGNFDIVSQGTMFTSLLDPEVKQAIAQEMLRVL